VRALAFAIAAAGLLTLGLGACGEGYSSEYSFVRTATVTLGQQTNFVLEAPVQVLVTGQPRSTDLVYELRATVTASTTTVARALSEAVTLKTEDTDSRGIRLVFEGADLTDGKISGFLRVWIPEDMDVSLVGRGGPVDVVDMAGALDLVGATHTRVTGATGPVRVRVDQGNAIAEVAALPGNTVELRTNAGDVQAILPPRPSVAIQAQTGNGAILVRHPGLPAYPGGDLPYGAVVNGGLAQVVLQTSVGNVVLDTQ